MGVWKNYKQELEIALNSAEAKMKILLDKRKREFTTQLQDEINVQSVKIETLKSRISNYGKTAYLPKIYNF